MSDASLGTATLRTQLDTSGLKTGLDTARAQTERTFNDMDKRVTAFGSKLQSFGTKWSLAITTPLTAIGVVGVRSAMQLETFSTTLNVLIGDTERAAAAFDELYEFSANTTFEWRALTEGTRVLAAFGVEAEDLVPTLSMLGDIAAGLDTPLEDLAQIFGRVRVTGRMGMEEVNRLADRGVPIYTELAKQMGVGEGAVRDLVSAGKVGFPELEGVFRSLTSEGGMFFGMMEAQTGTVAGRLARLKDSFEQVTDVVGERLLPTFDRLIAAGQAATDWFVDLDESTQSLIVGIGGFAAAVGPLAVGLGTIAKTLPLLRAGFAALLGPAGLLVLGVTAVAGLAIAFSGRGDSLDKAVEKASEAISGGDKDTITGALDEVIGKVDGPVKTVFQELRDDLVKTGDTGVEQVGRITRAIDATSQLIAAHRAVMEAEARVAEAQATESSFRATGVASDSRGLVFDPGREWDNLVRQLEGVGEAWVTTLLERAPDGTISWKDGGRERAQSEVVDLRGVSLVDALIARANEPIQALAAAVESSGLAGEAQAELAAANERLAEVLRYINEGQLGGAGGGGSDGSGAGGAAAKRTIETILKELDEAGTHAMRVAAFEGTTQAAVSAAQERVKLINSAIAELLTDPHYGLLPDGLLDELRERRDVAQAIVDSGGLGEIFNEFSDYLAGELEREVQTFRGGQRFPAPGVLTPMFDEWADYLATELEREVARMQAGHGMAQVGRYLQTPLTAPSAQVGGGSLTALRPPQVTAQLADQHTMSGSLFSQFSDYLDAETARQADRMRNMDLTTTNTDRAIIAERQLIMAREAAAAANNQLLADFARSEAERTAAMRYGGENATTYTEQLQLQAAAMKLAAEQGITLTEALERLSRTRFDPDEMEKRFTLSMALRARGGPGEPMRNADGGIVRRESYQERLKREQEAADQFANTVVNAGLQFGDAAIRAFKDGDIVGVIRAGLSGAGSILGGANLGSLSFLGGSIGIGGLIAGGLGLISSLIGGLFGGRRDAPENNRARGVTPRGAPAIDLTVMINQSLNIQSLTDPASRRAVDGLLDDMVRRLEDTLKRNVIPRLNALEGATA